MTSVLSLGRPISQMGSGLPPTADRPAFGEMVTVASDIFTVGQVINDNGQLTGSSSWGAANSPCALPFVLQDPATVYQLGWINGSAAGDNADIGIYSGDGNWTRLVSAGSTACAGNLTLQLVDVADTTLLANTTYYLVLVKDTTTANRIFRYGLGVVGTLALLGGYSSGTASLPLPDPLVGMVANTVQTFAPAMCMALRSTPI